MSSNQHGDPRDTDCVPAPALGHHAPNVNIEMIVTRLILNFNELVITEWRKLPDLGLAHMLDQSHNVTDPIESLMSGTTDVTPILARARQQRGGAIDPLAVYRASGYRQRWWHCLA